MPIEATAIDQVERVVALLGRVLGNDAVACYLHGSAVRSGLRRYSDLDILAVSARRLVAGDRNSLVDGLLSISSSDGSARPVELTIVAEPEVRPWRHPAQREFQYGEWLRGALEAGDLETTAAVVDPDLTLLIAVVLDGSTPLLGPAARTVFDPMPEADVKAALLDELPGIVRSTGTDTRNALLTLARIWCTLSTGRFHSKSEAANWALERLPDEQRAVLTRARDIYLGDQLEGWDGFARDIQTHTDFVVLQIHAAALHGQPQP